MSRLDPRVPIEDDRALARVEDDEGDPTLPTDHEIVAEEDRGVDAEKGWRARSRRRRRRREPVRGHRLPDRTTAFLPPRRGGAQVERGVEERTPRAATGVGGDLLRAIRVEPSGQRLVTATVFGRLVAERPAPSGTHVAPRPFSPRSWPGVSLDRRRIARAERATGHLFVAQERGERTMPVRPARANVRVPARRSAAGPSRRQRPEGPARGSIRTSGTLTGRCGSWSGPPSLD